MMMKFVQQTIGWSP